MKPGMPIGINNKKISFKGSNIILLNTTAATPPDAPSEL